MAQAKKPADIDGYISQFPADMRAVLRAVREANNSCEPNVGVQGQIVFVAMWDVAAGEELTLDYGTIDYNAEPMVCRCGAATCRGMITGEDWRRHDLQQKYGDHFAWHLLRRMRSEQ